MLNGALGFLAFWLIASGICLLLPGRLTERFGYPIESTYAKHAIAAACLAIAAGICVDVIHSIHNPSIATIVLISTRRPIIVRASILKSIDYYRIIFAPVYYTFKFIYIG